MTISPRIMAREICRVLECQPTVLYVAKCPWCRRPKSLMLDTTDGGYMCVQCGKQGDLTTLYREAEGRFLWKHRETVELMRGPGVSC